MVWFLVLLAVVVAGVALLAGHGRLGGMPPVVDDRPGLDLPETALTSEDLRGVRFAVTMRGYSMAQVDALLDRMANQLDAQRYWPIDEYDAWLMEGAAVPEIEDAPVQDDALPFDEDALSELLKPESTEAQPEATDALLESIEAQPEATDTLLESTEAQPEATDAQRDPSKTEPEPYVIEPDPEPPSSDPETHNPQPELSEAQID